MHEPAPRSHLLPGALAATCALTLASCGGPDQFANEPSPPQPTTVTALVDGRSVSVAPQRLGAGLVRILVANQSEERQTIGLRAAGQEEVPVTRTTDPIAVGATGELKLNLAPGTYRLGTGDDEIEAGVLELGPRRPAGSDQLLLP